MSGGTQPFMDPKIIYVITWLIVNVWDCAKTNGEISCALFDFVNITPVSINHEPMPLAKSQEIRAPIWKAIWQVRNVDECRACCVIHCMFSAVASCQGRHSVHNFKRWLPNSGSNSLEIIEGRWCHLGATHCLDWPYLCGWALKWQRKAMCFSDLHQEHPNCQSSHVNKSGLFAHIQDLQTDIN